MIKSQQYGQLQIIGDSDYNCRSYWRGHNGNSRVLLRPTGRPRLMECARSLQDPLLARSFAWTSFLSFCLLFIGASSWYVRRSERGWAMLVIGSQLGLLFGLGVIISGPIWGSAEWGVPWDWGDVRLNSYALLTSVALFLVMSIGVSQMARN